MPSERVAASAFPREEIRASPEAGLSGALVPDLPAPENKRFYPALDGLRATAVLMVFCQHYFNPFPSLDWGWAGVDLFFVLSGFLITGILYDTRESPHRVRNFYVRRTLRIFPLYYAVLLLLLLLTPIFHWVWHPSWALLPLYLGNYSRFLWLHDFAASGGALEVLRSSVPAYQPYPLYLGHFWSLCVEEQFYLVWPAFVFLIRDRARLRNLCLAVCVATLVARIACQHLCSPAYLQAELLYRFTPLRADALLFGGLLALMLRGPEAIWLARAIKQILYSAVAAFVVFESGYRIYAHQMYHPTSSPAMNTFGFSLVDWFAGLVILISLQPGTAVFRILTLKPLRWLGQMSYGFYVLHAIPNTFYGWLEFKMLGKQPHPGIYIAVIGLTATLILSYLSFRYFESPFLRLKDRFTVASG